MDRLWIIAALLTFIGGLFTSIILGFGTTSVSAERDESERTSIR